MVLRPCGRFLLLSWGADRAHVSYLLPCDHPTGWIAGDLSVLASPLEGRLTGEAVPRCRAARGSPVPPFQTCVRRTPDALMDMRTDGQRCHTPA